jgi:hypothetical protein
MARHPTTMAIGLCRSSVDTTRLDEIEPRITETSANLTVNENLFVVDSCIVAGNGLGAGSGHAARSCVDWN